MSIPKRIRVVYRKLLKHKVYGFAYTNKSLIEVDERLRGKKLFEILLHEALHLVNPNDTEEEIIDKSVVITKMLWQQGYRKIDNSNDMKLQDGSK